MPLKRTPPTSPTDSTVLAPPTKESIPVKPKEGRTKRIKQASLAVPTQQMHTSSSEPNLNASSVTMGLGSEGEYKKLSATLLDMTKTISEFKQQQEKSFQKMEQICTAAEEMKLTVDYFAEKYGTLKEMYDKLEHERKNDLKYIKTLEDKLESCERSARSSCLEIRNIPSSASETKSSLVGTVITTCKVLNVPIQEKDVKDIYRIKTKDPSNRTLIVDLCSVLLKEKVIAMYRKFNKNTTKLTTEQLRIGGPMKQIFISENLSSKMKKLFYLAREYAKANDYKFCWLAHGKIFLRKRENGPLARIMSEADLNKLTNQQ